MIQLVDSIKCTGCMACYNICPKGAINIILNDVGFFEPSIDGNKCIDCKSCIQSCPSNYSVAFKKTISMHAARSMDEELYLKSSSGGIFGSIARYILSLDGVVFGAVWKNEYSVEHAIARNELELSLMFKSKYLQSSIKSIFKAVKTELGNDKIVLFSGTPCQIAGLKAYLGNDEKNLVTVDIICHGVPSGLLFKHYIEYLSKSKEAKILQYDFRYKDKKIGHYLSKYIIKKECLQHQFIGNYNMTSYSYYFMHNYFLRNCCYSCNYANEMRVGDITLGDYWGIENIHPDFDSRLGASLVLINSDKGEFIFSQLKNIIIECQTDSQYAISHNSQLQKPSIKPIDNDELFNSYCKEGYLFLEKEYKQRIGFCIESRMVMTIKRYMPLSIIKILKKLTKKKV